MKNRLRFKTALLPAIIAAGLLAAACSDEPDPTTTSTAGSGISPTATSQATAQATTGATSTAPAATAAATSQPTSTPPSGPSAGGTLKIASVGSIESFDPLWTTASGTGNVSHTILEGLFVFTDDYSLGQQLIDSWSTSSDNLTWTFTIRSGVEFHDGTPMTTDQVIGTLNRLQARSPVLKLVHEQFGPAAFSDFITKEDDLTFNVNLESPTGLVLYAIGPQNFAPLIVTDEWAAVSAEVSAEGAPIGTGPYKFENWTPGDRWSLVRCEEYSPSSDPADGLAGAQIAYFDRVEYIEIADQNTRTAALETGEVDMAQEFPADLAPQLAANPDIQLVPLAPNRLLGHFNHLKPPFDNVIARQALIKAYDNESALLLATGDENAIRLCPSLMQCGTSWETDAGSEGFYNANNVDEARAMIEDAGLAGTRVRLMDPTDRQPAHAGAQVSREVLEDIGFDVEFVVMDWATMVSRRADPELWEFFHTWSGVTVRSGPVGHLAFGELQYDAWFNHYQDVPGTQRALFEQLASATEEGDQRRIMDDFQTYFYEDAIFLQVGEFFSQWAARADLQGIVPESPAAQLPANKRIE